VHLVPRATHAAAKPALRNGELVVERAMHLGPLAHGALVRDVRVDFDGVEPLALASAAGAVRLPALPLVVAIAPALDDGARKISASHVAPGKTKRVTASWRPPSRTRSAPEREAPRLSAPRQVASRQDEDPG